VAFQPCDITKEGDCEALVAAAEERFGGVDCVVNNAASTARGITLEDGAIDDWRPVFEVNFFGSLRLVKAAIPALKRSQGGSVVFVGSQIVRRVFAGRGPYASSKAALLTAAQVLARELGPYGIRVNTVVPGRNRHDVAPGRLGPAQCDNAPVRTGDPGQVPLPAAQGTTTMSHRRCPDHVNVTSSWLPRPARGDQDRLAGLLCLEHM